MKTIEIKDLMVSLQQLKKLTWTDDNGEVSFKKLWKRKNRKYCQSFLDFALNFRNFLYDKVNMETKIREVKNLNRFTDNLITYLESLHFSGNKPEMLTDAIDILFTTITYHKAFLNIMEKSPELFYFYKKLETLELLRRQNKNFWYPIIDNLEENKGQ